ncbi:MAG: hypothetical protein DRP57_11860 [Spirochaetes bacterium]|nr:MAG: hypothetical protein DRP57_11860 [Spirochaetota bacterium]
MDFFWDMLDKGINLLPQDIQETERQRLALRKTSILGAGVLAVTAGLVLLVFSSRNRVEESWFSLREEIVAKEAVINQEENRRLEAKLVVVRSKIDNLKSYFDKQTDFASFLEVFFTKIPSGVEMVALSETDLPDGQWEFSGVADSLDRLEVFVDNLKSWDKVGEVEVKSLSYKVEKSSMPFELIITRKDS